MKQREVELISVTKRCRVEKCREADSKAHALDQMWRPFTETSLQLGGLFGKRYS